MNANVFTGKVFRLNLFTLNLFSVPSSVNASLFTLTFLFPFPAGMVHLITALIIICQMEPARKG